MISMDLSTYRKVVSGELTPEQGAQAFMRANDKEELVKRPTWMPKSLYVVAVVIGAIIFAPILNSRDRA